MKPFTAVMYNYDVEIIFLLPDHWYYLFATACAIVGLGSAFSLGKQRVSKSPIIQWVIALILLLAIVGLFIVFVRPYSDACNRAGGTLKYSGGYFRPVCVDKEDTLLLRKDYDPY